ncbi:tyrosine-type recombinase/integrase [Bifidobacterium mizhiense]|uniref:tyrosine-type recombinase/integrase n=1 Tax=Bifidobacterium mizhiense TaxID=2879940 RepID=UPI0024DEA1ED|nr:tyrosine-type recombinase/integrase [Bifidobacterium mizhiense]
MAGSIIVTTRCDRLNHVSAPSEDDVGTICSDVKCCADFTTPHSLRRTFATLLQETGVPDHDIIAAAGWVDDTTLNYYDMHNHAIQGKATSTLSQYLA